MSKIFNANKKLFFVCIVCCGIFALLMWNIFFPKLVLEKTTIDIGTVHKGDVVVRKIKIYNKGLWWLKIHSVRTGCGCSHVSVSNNLIPPGGIEYLTVFQSDKGATSGTNIANFFIVSNDPRHPVYPLQVKYEFFSDDSILPHKIDFGNVKKNELPYSRYFYLRSNLIGKKFTMISECPYIDVNVDEKDNGTLHVKLKSDIPSGELYDYISIIDSTDPYLTYKTNVIGSVIGNYYTVPKMIDFGTINDLQTSLVRTVKVISKEKEIFTVTNVQLLGDIKNILNVQIMTTDQNSELRILTVCLKLICYEKSLSTHEVTGKILFKCINNKNEEEDIMLPVRLNIRTAKIRSDLYNYYKIPDYFVFRLRTINRTCHNKNVPELVSFTQRCSMRELIDYSAPLTEYDDFVRVGDQKTEADTRIYQYSSF
jgi:hypothetical protein